MIEGALEGDASAEPTRGAIDVARRLTGRFALQAPGSREQNLMISGPVKCRLRHTNRVPRPAPLGKWGGDRAASVPDQAPYGDVCQKKEHGQRQQQMIERILDLTGTGVG